MVYFLCVNFLLILIVESESVKHREFSWFMSSCWLRLYPGHGHIQTSEVSRFQKVTGSKLLGNTGLDPNSKVDLWMRFFRKGHWDGFHLPFYVFNLWEDISFSLCVFSCCPAGWIATLERKLAFRPTRHVGRVEGPKTIPSQHRDLAGFLKTENLIERPEISDIQLIHIRGRMWPLLLGVTIGFARPYK